MPTPELFTVTHDGEIVRTFLNACDTFLSEQASKMRIQRLLLPKFAFLTLHISGTTVKVMIKYW